MKNKALVVVCMFIFSTFGIAGLASAVDKPPQQAVFVLSPEEFKVQREFMILDLEKKIELLQTAKKCAEGSVNAVGFQMCNQAFLDGVAAHNLRNSKAKKGGAK